MIGKLFQTVFSKFLKYQSGMKQINFQISSVSNNDFENAKLRLNKLRNDPGSEQKLRLYGLYKQATEGECTKPKPSMVNFVERAKWDAWSKLKEMKKEEAMKTYISVVDVLVKEQGPAEEKSEGAVVNDSVDGINLTKENGILTIKLNRPDKKNALTWDMYKFWADTLNKADKDDSVKVVVVTGNGDYFCSGNDLTNFSKMGPNETPQQMALKGKNVLLEFVGSFIDFSKPLIALVNGPAIGITVTTLALYDAVFASDKATFITPFSVLGQTPEGCSSSTFPKIFGPVKANQMLMFNKKLTATEAAGLVSVVIDHKVFEDETKRLVNEIAALPPQTLRYSKELIRGGTKRQKLHKVNKIECDRLMERWLSEECIQAITKFFNKKKANL